MISEVALDANRAWCPSKDCGALCHVCDESSSADAPKAVKCQSCSKEFCSLCSGNWHPDKTCTQYGQSLFHKNTVIGGGGRLDAISPVGSDFLFALNGGGPDGADIKPCPMCRVLIERDAGCAQMMCKRCKHVFCWFCRESLDVSGEQLCRSRSSIILANARMRYHGKFIPILGVKPTV